MAKVTLLGGGGWSIGLSCVLSDNQHDVTIWSFLQAEAEMLREKRENTRSLPGVKIGDSVKVTTDLKEAVTDADAIIIATASSYVRSTAHSLIPFVKKGQVIINVAKGIEEESLMTMTEIISDELPDAKVAVLSGPSHAEEVGKRMPTCVVAGAKTKATAEYIQELFANSVFRVYTSPDVLGIELGGSLKNVIALAAGIADGLGFGDNTKAALITRGIKEIGKLGDAMGAKLPTFAGLSGIGDLIVTCASMHSRNRRAGILIGQGKSMGDAMAEVNMVVEGVFCAKAAWKMAQKYQIDMPIIEQVNAVLFDNKSAKEAIVDLMLRDKTSENSSLPWTE